MRHSFYATLSLLGILSVTWGQRTCNNSPALCDRKYNNVTYLGAHDSPFLRNAANGFSPFGNQYYNSTTQLDAGVRLLTAQVHNDDGTSWDLCHSACVFLNAGSLTNWLRGIKTWLDNHPNEVVTILLVNADNANATTLNDQFQAADIVDYAYVPPSTSSATNDWPTLNNMVDDNKRLVVWIANLNPASNTVAPYLLDQFTFVFENNYDISDPATFGCEPDRPNGLRGRPIDSVLSSGYLPLMNHFLYNRIGSISTPAEDKVENTNAATGNVGNLGDHATKCALFYGKAPTYVLVDFFNVARAIDTVDRLNGVQGQTSGRISLPDTVNGSRADSDLSLPLPLPGSSNTTPVNASPTTGVSNNGGTTVSSSTTTPTPNRGVGHKRCKQLKYAAPVIGALAMA